MPARPGRACCGKQSVGPRSAGATHGSIDQAARHRAGSALTESEQRPRSRSSTSQCVHRSPSAVAARWPVHQGQASEHQSAASGGGHRGRAQEWLARRRPRSSGRSPSRSASAGTRGRCGALAGAAGAEGQVLRAGCGGCGQAARGDAAAAHSMGTRVPNHSAVADVQEAVRPTVGFLRPGRGRRQERRTHNAGLRVPPSAPESAEAA